MIAFPASSCAIAETARVVRYLAEETAGQCGPCVFGLPALADALGALAYGGGRDGAVGQVAALLPLIERRGACRHPDGVPSWCGACSRRSRRTRTGTSGPGACDGVAAAPRCCRSPATSREWDFR